MDLRYTLVCDGSSDAALLPILDWLLVECGVVAAVQRAWADLRLLRRPPSTLAERVQRAVDLYPCELLFVHRDAESQAPERRRDEIAQALEPLPGTERPPHVCVIPVRMTEAWLLIDEGALRGAAGNSQGMQPLEMPSLTTMESVPDPKQVLYQLLATASGLKGRRLKRFSSTRAALRVTEFISDFSPLRHLSAFAALEAEVRDVLEREGWNTVPSP